MRRHPNRGFTLVELMISVAIIGILASVAVPTFRNFAYRSRQAERGTINRALVIALDEVFAREGRFPNGTQLFSYVWGNFNPDATPTTTKVPWRLTGPDDWQRIPFQVEGAVYYRYYVWAYAVSGTRLYELFTLGDLDGDGLPDRLLKIYQYQGVVLQKPDYGPAYHCDDCSYQYPPPYPNTF